jgi:ribosomal protein L37AE/L43A
MRSNRKKGESVVVRVELKYCEHCGGLWVRERGTGEVYCEKCQAKVAELPAPKKNPARVMLPLQSHSAIDECGTGIPEEVPDLEAAGGVA